MRRFENYIKSIRQQGKSYFTSKQVLQDLDMSKAAFYVAIHRLKKKREIVSPARDLYIIVLPEDYVMGCVPAEQLVVILMKHLQLDYYACLLTAGMYFGAAHQKPQVFQVMTTKRIKPLHCGRIKVDFIYKKSISDLPTQKFDAKVGYMEVATPEVTAMDLLLYPRHSGGINNIATVLAELIESMNVKKLIEIAEKSGQNAWVQRLGFILETIDVMDEDKKERLLRGLECYLKAKKLKYVALAPGLPTRGCKRHEAWMIIENTTVESDL